ncbi:MAG: RluA family pseudouridine synthase [Saprospiraceae bacterium]
MRIPIVFSDDHLLVIDKPADLLTVPDRFDDEKPFVFGVLRDRYPELLPVHRLDRQTSGLLAIARTKEAHRALNDHFSNRRVAKDYLALVDGTPHPAKGTIDQPIANSPEKPGKMMVTQRDGKPAQTDYEVLESFKDFSWLSVRIHTGRTHQIRVHLAYLGHPLAVDELYGRRSSFMLSEWKGRRKYHLKAGKTERPLLDRASLHAAHLAFPHPITGEPLDFRVDPPKDLRATLNQLRKL